MRRFVCFALLTASLASQALGWGEEGHAIVCAIAEQRLSSAGRALVARVQSYRAEIRDPFRSCAGCTASHPDDGRAMSFAESCWWADEARVDTFRDTYDYHFVDVPRGVSFDFARDCRRLDCAPVAIQRYAQTLAERTSGSREKERQALALRFLGHFVGDLHQPLHVGNVEDLGGNALSVKWLRRKQTLHAVWDSGILARAKLAPASAAALNESITPAQAKRWSSFDVLAWTRESNALARGVAYVQPNGARVKSGDSLGADYFERARPVATEQLQRAGVRLALLIDAAARGTLPQNLLAGE